MIKPPIKTFSFVPTIPRVERFAASPAETGCFPTIDSTAILASINPWPRGKSLAELIPKAP